MNCTAKIDFKDQMKKAENGLLVPGDGMYVCTTPQVLVSLGCAEIPVIYGQKHFRDAFCGSYDDEQHLHQIPKDVMSNLPHFLAHPAFVFDSPTREDSIVVVLNALDALSQPLWATIHVNGIGTYEGIETSIPVNYISSIYGKRPDGMVASLIRAFDSGNLLYFNCKGSIHLAKKIGRSIPYQIVHETPSRKVLRASAAAARTAASPNLFNKCYI